VTKSDSGIDLYVLDSIADDVEDLESILRMLNSDSAIGWHRAPGRHFERQEVVEALSRLVRSDLARVSVLDGKHLVELKAGQLPPESYDHAWFAITARGRVVHTTWDPQSETP
jgi:hypothetical protein